MKKTIFASALLVLTGCRYPLGVATNLLWGIEEAAAPAMRDYLSTGTTNFSVSEWITRALVNAIPWALF